MKAAIIGLGVICPPHVKSLLERGIEIVAVCDNDEKKLSGFNEKYGINAKYYTDYRALLNGGGIDTVHICTPHYLHTEMILAALDAGCHVLCEKPLCIDEKDIEALTAAQKRAERTVGVCFQNRYNLSTVQLKKLLSGKQIDAAYGQLVWQRTKAYYQSADWRGKWATEGGGVMINQAIHTLDLLIEFCGMPEFITAKTGNFSLQDVIEVEDTATVHATGKTSFNLYATNASPADFPVEIRLICGKDSIELSGDSVIVNGQKTDFTPQTQRETPKACYGTGHYPLIKDFYDCLESGEPFPVGIESAARSIKVIAAIYKSDGKKVPVSV